MKTVLFMTLIFMGELSHLGKIEYDFSEDFLNIRVFLSKPIDSFKSFVIDTGETKMIVFDLFNVIWVNGKKRIIQLPPNEFKTIRIRTAQFDNRPIPVTRVVIDLREFLDFEAEKKDSVVIITLRRESKTQNPYLKAKVEYIGIKRRDPFEEIKVFQGEEKLLKLSTGCKLKGIVDSEKGERLALVVDETGYGWVLKKGDRVQRGWVGEIGRNFATFYVVEGGVLRRVKLEIEREEIKQ